MLSNRISGVTVGDRTGAFKLDSSACVSFLFSVECMYLCID